MKVSNNKKILVISIICITILSVLGLLFPVTVYCGAPNYTCTTAPDDNGYIGKYIEIEPFGVMLIELVTQKNFPFKYNSYQETIKIGDEICVEEGKYIPVIVPEQYCCEGLRRIELTQSEKQLDGISGKCVK